MPAPIQYLRIIFLLLFLFPVKTAAVTLVYRMPLRRVFNLAEAGAKGCPHTYLTILPTTFFRKSAIPEDSYCVLEKRRVDGSIFNIRYDHCMKWWVEATTGIEHDRAKFTKEDEKFCGGRTGFDDIVFTAGYRYFHSYCTQLIPYALLGLPTRRKIDREERFGPFVGTRFVNVGVGGEASYSCINQEKRTTSLVWQGRVIHGFERSWFPILPPDATISPGNFIDFIFAVQHSEANSVAQGGYNLTIFTNHSKNYPGKKIEGQTFSSNTAYFNYAYTFKKGLFNKSTVVGCGGSVSKLRRFNSRSFEVWAFITQTF